jgi:hypothetical protein
MKTERAGAHVGTLSCHIMMHLFAAGVSLLPAGARFSISARHSSNTLPYNRR